MNNVISLDEYKSKKQIKLYSSRHHNGGFWEWINYVDKTYTQDYIDYLSRIMKELGI